MKRLLTRKMSALILATALVLTSCVRDNSSDSSQSAQDTLSTQSTQSTQETTIMNFETTAPHTTGAIETTSKSQTDNPQSIATTDQGEVPTPNNNTSNQSGFAKTNGALKVDGANLVNSKGQKIQLYGMSTHGIAWFPQYVNKEAFKTLRDDWKTNAIRIAMYSDEYGGYSNGGDKTKLKNLVKNAVNYATELGMYVIIDWHILRDQDPNVHKADAIAFFDEMASLYKNHTNVLYEICNEPNGSGTWDKVTAYANEVIPVIRKHDKDAVIIVGTPTWSQEVDKALAQPLKFDNVMYALHFYADTHKDYLRDRLEQCASKGLPILVSEFGLGSADGNGSNNYGESKAWLDLLDKHNISYFAWNLANKNESSSVFKTSTTKTSGWSESELSDSGKYLRNWFRNKSN